MKSTPKEKKNKSLQMKKWWSTLSLKERKRYSQNMSICKKSHQKNGNKY